jgi:hypothetical protein
VIKFADVVFLQGEDAEPALSILDSSGWEALAQYLSAWDDGNDLELHCQPSAGAGDDQRVVRDYYFDCQPKSEQDQLDIGPFELVAVGEVAVRDYLINVNRRLRYVSMERIVPDDESEDYPQ